jgi:hypothetical protein
MIFGHSWYDFCRDQGSILAGLLALLAALVTTWVIWRTSRRTIEATKSSAEREISAAQEQTKVAQDQIATTLRLEQRRLAREEWAFAVTMEAAMNLVINDAIAAVELAADLKVDEELIYDAQQRIRKSSFDEL